MKKNIVFSALLLAGSFLFCGAASGRVRSGVIVDGVEIGGLPYAVAEARVRERYTLQPFHIQTPRGEREAGIDMSDDLSALVRRAKKGQVLQSETRREWATAEEEIEDICRANAYDATDATVAFTKSGEFYYTPEKDGLACSYTKTLENALRALREGEERCALETRVLKPRVTYENLRARTQKLASFTTYFDGENKPRSHNIALAASRIGGTVLPAGGEFSFNQTVGARSRENGFLEASVIVEGEFVPGVGGGVCQASTTLMNCAVRAGLRVTECRAHSLSVGYVSPSCDAMVSSYSDLKFENPYDVPVYLAAKTGDGWVSFTAYGLPDGKEYCLESNVRARVEPPAEKVVKGDEDKIIRQARTGIASESYLCVYENGKLLFRELFRRDSYAVVQGVRQEKERENTTEN